MKRSYIIIIVIVAIGLVLGFLIRPFFAQPNVKFEPNEVMGDLVPLLGIPSPRQFAFLQDGTLFASSIADLKLRTSTDHGLTWTEIFEATEGDEGITCFVDSREYIFFGTQSYGKPRPSANRGKLYRSVDEGMTFTEVIILPKGRNGFWHMTEDRLGYLYIGTYSKPADVYRSKDGGETWDVVYSAPEPANHIHMVKADPYSGYIYAGWGDTGKGVARSMDTGETWTVIWNTTESQIIGLGFTEKYRILGADTSPYAIWRTEDDVNFEKMFELSPRVYPDYHSFCFEVMVAPSGVVYTGWVRQSGNIGGLYASPDECETMIRLFSGSVSEISEVDPYGFIYVSGYRFRDMSIAELTNLTTYEIQYFRDDEFRHIRNTEKHYSPPIPFKFYNVLTLAIYNRLNEDVEIYVEASMTRKFSDSWKVIEPILIAKGTRFAFNLVGENGSASVFPYYRVVAYCSVAPVKNTLEVYVNKKIVPGQVRWG